MKIKALDHILLCTKNADASIQFYKMLGFTVQDTYGRYELSAEGCRIHLYKAVKENYLMPKNAVPGCVEICLELDNGINELKKYLQQQGVTIEEGIMPRSGRNGAMRSFLLYDPDGNLVEIATYNE